MKDIEILEEFAKEYKDTGYFGIIKAEQIQILDKILKERQADKEKINKLEKHLKFYEKDESYKKRILELEEENFKIKHLMRNPNDISINLVNDKIKKLNKELNKVEQMNACATRYDTIQKLDNQIAILEELLKDGGE